MHVLSKQQRRWNLSVYLQKQILNGSISGISKGYAYNYGFWQQTNVTEINLRFKNDFRRFRRISRFVFYESDIYISMDFQDNKGTFRNEFFISLSILIAGTFAGAPDRGDIRKKMKVFEVIFIGRSGVIFDGFIYCTLFGCDHRLNQRKSVSF